MIEITADNLTKLRDETSPLLKELDDQVDSRDVERLLTDDVYAGFFLQWNHKMESAVKMVLKSLKWRKLYGVNDLSVDSIGVDFVKRGYFFVSGRALDGTRILHFKTGQIEKKDRETNMKLVVFWFERVQRCEPDKKITILMDTTGSRLTQADTGFSTFIIECCATYFPGMMKKIIIYNLPTLLNAFWKLISKMLSEEQREATVVCNKDDLLKHIDKDNLTEDMGGTMKFQYSYPPFPDDLEKK